MTVKVGVRYSLYVLVIIIFLLTAGLYFYFYENEYSKKVPKNIIENTPTPKGLLSLSSELVLKECLDFSNINISDGIITNDPSGAELHVNVSKISKGIIHLSIVGVDESRIRIGLKQINMEFSSEMIRDYHEGYYPLIFGSGDYELIVLAENINGNFSEVSSVYFNADFDINEPYKYSNVFSSYDESSILVAKAYQLTRGLDKNYEKVEKIAKFIRFNIKYDDSFTKEKINSGDEIYMRGKGVCYNYSSLFSAMMKSVGVPTREVRGFTLNSDDYHSWNEFMNDSGEWESIDVFYTYDEQSFIRDDYSER